MVEGFPKVLGFGGTGQCLHVSVYKARDVKAPNSLKVQLAQIVLGRVQMIEESL